MPTRALAAEFTPVYAPGAFPAAGWSPTAAGAPAAARAVARGWFVIAIGSLVLAGLLSLTLVIGRLPFLGTVFTDPLFFRRALVVHVDLAMVVWFQAGTLAFLGLAFGDRLSRRLVAAAFLLCGLGLAGALVPGAQPILCNCVPVIDHSAFLAGLVAWFAGTGLFFAGVLAVRGRTAHVADEVAVALRAAALVAARRGRGVGRGGSSRPSVWARRRSRSASASPDCTGWAASNTAPNSTCARPANTSAWA